MGISFFLNQYGNESLIGHLEIGHSYTGVAMRDFSRAKCWISLFQNFSTWINKEHFIVKIRQILLHGTQVSAFQPTKSVTSGVWRNLSSTHINS